MTDPARLVRLAALAAALVPGLAQAQLLAAGDPTADSVVLWARTDDPGNYRFEVALDPHFGTIAARREVRTQAQTGLTAQATLQGLSPSTRYYFRLVSDAAAYPTSRATFATAPESGARQTVKFLFGADLGGQGYGRLRPGTGLLVDGWPIFAPMAAESADFFVALGDMVYADRPITTEAPDRKYPKGNDLQIPKPGPGFVKDLPGFREDWLYHRSDRHYDHFLRATPIVATWDDHETVNDGGGPELTVGPTAAELARDPRLRQGDPARPRGEFMPWSTTKSAEGRRKSVFFNPTLYAAGRRALFEWNPIAVIADPARPGERLLYRSLRWGAHAELIVLDTRSYRDPRYREDTAAAPKTMLGAAQKRWLKERLENSAATWKLVVSSVPLALEGGNEKDPQGRGYRDAWARAGEENPYGYSRELQEIVDHIRDRKVRNVVFLTGDKHFTNLFSYDPDRDGRPDFHEANVGPLRSGPASGKVELDGTLNPTRLYTDAGKSGFAYGSVMIDGDTGRLTIRIHDDTGKELPGARLALDPQGASR